jgi:predicted permease
MQPGAVLKSAGRGLTAGKERFSLRRMLVVVQVALSLVLVAGAVLFSRSLGKLITVDTGFRQEGVLLAIVDFQPLHLVPERSQNFSNDVIDRIRAVPGIESAATGMIPLRDSGGNRVWMEGTDAHQGKGVNRSRIGRDYFRTLQIPLLAGRDFDANDKIETPKVAIVNEAFARALLNGANPVGERFWLEATPGSPEMQYQIVGLVGDTKYEDLREEFGPIFYDASSQNDSSWSGAQVLIHSRLPQSETVSSVKRVLNDMNPAINVNFQWFKPMIDATILRERLMATLSGFFGVLALLLACIGLYGILSYGVASRTNEIGIRMALGAGKREVSWLILREALMLVVAGVAVGLPVIFVVTRMAATLLFRLTPTDPVSLIFAALLMVAVAMLAGYLPSRRATRVDPMVALRTE